MKKILLLNGSISEIPLIHAAKKLGCYVITSGNMPQLPGHKLADEYISADFSDAYAILKIARDNEVDGIVSCANDFGYLTAAYVCEKLGLPGHDDFKTACAVHHKDAFRKIMKDSGLRTPRVFVCRSEDDIRGVLAQFSAPLVIKPTDLTGGKGVSICKNEKEALDGFSRAMKATRQDHVICEEFIEGKNYGASFILKNDRVIAAVFGNELYYKNNFLVSGACTAADLPLQTRQQLCRDIETISKKLDLCDGLFHVQFIADKNGTAVIIDPCRRAPGDLYVTFAKYVTMIDFPDLIVQSELGIMLPDLPRAAERYIARMCLMTDKNGTIKGLRTAPELEKHIIDREIWAKPGDRIESYLTYKAGIVFLEYASAPELYTAYERFHELMNIDVKEGE